MAQKIVNSNQRSFSMFRFGSMFIGSVILVCFLFFRTCTLYNELPQKEFEELRKKEAIAKALSEVGKFIQEFEIAERENLPEAPAKRALADSRLGAIFLELQQKDTVLAYKDMNKLYQMTIQYFAFVKSRGSTEGSLSSKNEELRDKVSNLQQDLNDCNRDKERAENRVDNLERDVRTLQLQVPDRK